MPEQPEKHTGPGPDAPGGEAWEAALASAARRAGLDGPAEGAVTGRSVVTAIGGVRGVLESVIPGLLFVLLVTLQAPLPVALGVSVGVAVLFVLARVLQKGAITPAIGGLLGTALSAALSLFTGRAADNFLVGIGINAVFGIVLLVSVLIGWPLIGLAIGFLYEEGTRWRRDRRRFRIMQGITLLWVALFAIRLAVELPLYLADNAALLGTFKLVLGLPLYAPLLVLTWLVARATFGGRAAAGVLPGEH